MLRRKATGQIHTDPADEMLRTRPEHQVFGPQGRAPHIFGAEGAIEGFDTDAAGISALLAACLAGQPSVLKRPARSEVGAVPPSNLSAIALEMFAAVLEASPDTISIADATCPDMPLVYVNPAFTDTTGYEAQDVIGRNCRFLQGPQTDPNVVRNLADTVRQQKSGAFEILNYRRDGQPFVNALKLTPVFDAGGSLVAYLGIQRDITEEKLRAQHDRVENRLEALGLASGALAHELNNLLQPAISLLALHGPEMPDQRIRNDLEIVRESTMRAADLSNNLLAMTKGVSETAGRLTPISAALDRSHKLLQVLLPVKVQLYFQIGKDVRAAKVVITEADFFQVIMNTVLNAAQATGTGGTVRVDVSSAAPDLCEICISDNGPGIPEADRLNVLKPFVTHGRKDGTGLGLHIVNTIISEAGGTLAIEAGLTSIRTTGFGCRIRMTLPIT